jgi:glycosyltransferase involved in cell wall biosynthesis
MKNLIFIVAYRAERHIASVFARIPYDRLPEGTELLLIDDASNDATFAVAKEAAAKWPIKSTLLKNPVNLGYGGNQKLGYEFAIKQGFHNVILIHGDGQYAPELIPQMLEPLISGGADLVLGSRMMRKQDAIKGGMPLYKWIGNQVLTWLENRILGMNLTEFHTGLRAYSTAALQRIPFHLNTNDFHFDTDILIQCHRVGSRFHEIPIPTRYGDEVCHVDGWNYFFGCLRSCVRDWMTQKGIFYCRRFDIAPPQTRYESKLDFEGSSHSQVLEMVEKGSRVLDIGGGNGWIADQLRDRSGCEVTIVDQFFRDQPELKHRTISMDLSREVPERLGEFDAVLMLDILEHLPRAQQTRILDNLRNEQTEKTRFLISVPNTAFFPLRAVFFLFGQLNYGRRGILDDTHAFLFTRKSLRELLADCGFRIAGMRFTPPPYELALGAGNPWRALTRLHAFLARLLPSIFAYQIIVEATPLPTVGRLLQESIRHSETLRGAN